MKRKLNKSLSATPPILTKQTITFHLNSLNIKRGTKTYDVDNLEPGVGQAQTCSGAKLVKCDLNHPL